jgi:phage terminase large subunit-like protein
LPDDEAAIFGRLKAAIDSMVTFSPGQEAARKIIESGPRHMCLAGGTRSGKSFLIVREQTGVALRAPHSRHAMLRNSFAAARASLWLDTQRSVLRRCFPNARYEEHRQDGYIQFENGSQIWIGGLGDKERVERILGQEYLTVFLNEASQIGYSSFLVAMTRLAQSIPGERQRAFVDLNPVAKTHWTNQLFGEKRDPISRRPLANPDDYARAFLNPTDNAQNLSREYIASLENLPERQRKRFYEGLYIDELEGALWTIDTIEKHRVDPTELPTMTRIVVAIDPAVSSGENADETGIIVAGLGVDGQGYILADVSGKYLPMEWASRAVSLYHLWRADKIIGEVNQGGALIEATLRVVDPNVPIKSIHASRGKIVRAEPVAALAAQGKLHHAGVFSELEDQMISFTVGSTKSPDRLDAACYAINELMVGATNDGFIEYYRILAEEGRYNGGPQLNPPLLGQPRASDAMIAMKAPPGLSCLYTITGRQVTIPADGIVMLTEEEAKPMLQHGWTKVEITQIEGA